MLKTKFLIYNPDLVFGQIIGCYDTTLLFSHSVYRNYSCVWTMVT